MMRDVGTKRIAMRTRLLLVTAAVLAGAAALAQPRITSFNSSGELTWTNSARVGAYRVEWANSPAGRWNAFGTRTNLDSIWAETNHVTAQLPLSNAPTFYRVAWTRLIQSVCGTIAVMILKEPSSSRVNWPLFQRPF